MAGLGENEDEECLNYYQKCIPAAVMHLYNSS